MVSRYKGTLIRQKRIEKNWSQEGLARGVCSVSYLSKIEQGKAEASTEIINLLGQRLGIKVSEEKELRAGRIAEEGYESLFGRNSVDSVLLEEMKEERLLDTEYGIDLLLLKTIAERGAPLKKELEEIMDLRQQALQQLLKGNYLKAIYLFPNGFFYFRCGEDAYERGEYSVAVEYLQTGYDHSAKEGAVNLMVYCKALMGNCYSNQQNLNAMYSHYKVAERLAKAIGDKETLRDLGYNKASTQIEVGLYEEAYGFLSSMENPSKMSLHKLAICCEKMNKVEEGKRAVEEALAMESIYPSKEIGDKMCQVVKYRLEHSAYLEDETYGKLLLDCFSSCKENLHRGYVVFHVPWMIEWYIANRQYKNAYEVSKSFPVKYD